MVPRWFPLVSSGNDFWMLSISDMYVVVYRTGNASTPSPCLHCLVYLCSLKVFIYRLYMVVTWFASVNRPFHRITESAFLYLTPGRLMLPTARRCRMWGSSSIFGSSQRRLWLHFLRQVLGGFLFLLASEGCFLSFRLLASLTWVSLSLNDSTSEEQVKGNHTKGCKEKNDTRETGGLICPCKSALPFHLPKHAPQTQLVNVKQFTRLWYKLINDRQLAWRERGKKKKGQHMITSFKEKKRTVWHEISSSQSCCAAGKDMSKRSRKRWTETMRIHKM